MRTKINHKFFISITAALMISTSTYGNSPEYDQCLMRALKGDHSSQVSMVITDACKKIHVDGALLLPRERNYYACLVQNLVDVRHDLAAQQIDQVCLRQNSL